MEAVSDTPIFDPWVEARNREVRHGFNCMKIPHKPSRSYMHDELDDSGYDVDGVTYCGRCHSVIQGIYHLGQPIRKKRQ